jgi:hypothetical protein
MTLWLEESTLKEHFINSTNADAEISDISDVGDGRRAATIVYQEPLTVDGFEWDSINRFLTAIGDGDPELEFDSQAGSLQIRVISDISVWRD